MLIGSIGIINTMQVVVRRRTLEVAVLKTIGLQAGQVTVLFLTEAFIMGVLGSIVGVLFGWAATLLIKGAATAFVGQELAFRIAWQPVFNGLFVGTLVTTVFGFMPTLSAGQVRPGIVLRPSQTVIPRAGFFRNLLAVIFTVLALSLITRTILGGSYVQALAIVGGAFVAAGMMFVVLLVILWIIGRLLPSFGVVDLKVALRQMLTTRGRGATTLLALIVGIFALSTITMFTETFRNLLDFAIDEGTRGNVQVVSLTANTDQIVDAINTVEAVDSYWIDRRYEVTFNSVTKAGSGETVHAESLQAQINRSRDQLREQGVTEIGQVSNLFSQIGGRTVDQIEGPDTGFVAGRNFTPADDGQPYIVLRASDTLTAAGIEPGDTLNFTLAGGIFGGQQTLSLEVIGIAASTDFNIEFSPAHYTLMGALPDGRGPDETSVQVDIPPENVRDLRRAIADVPGAIVLDLDLFLGFIQTLVEQFRAFPTLVAALGLAVGGIIIANSVALATIERRHEIAIMKSIGLQRERVLGMLLLENAILGLIGGLIGVGFGLVALSYFTAENEIPLDTVPYGTGALLMGLCILVALIAAMTSAWNASGEKPLNVLRYE